MSDDYRGKRQLLRVNLHFFDGGEKTEQPTSRKKGKARGEGQVAKSPEVSTALLFIAVFFGLKVFAPGMFTRMLSVFTYSFQIVGDVDAVYDLNYITNLVWYLLAQALLIAAPILVISLLVGLITNIIQVGWHPTTKPLMPKLSKLNPLSGIKRLFSFRVLVDLVKSIAKFAVILYVIYSMIKNQISHIPELMSMEIFESLVYIGNPTVDLGLNVGIYFIFIALADYMYARFKHNKDLKMSKQEVKEEYKNVEGNPQIKGKIRQKMREVSMRRMMQDLPNADVIITNPTHYAVAIQYKKDEFMAPIVTAKGADFLAKRIKTIAAENGVEIVENKQLARTIYATVDVGKEIPPELYQAVAEILAFVYKLKNKAQ